MSIKKILITGANGSVGYHLVERLHTRYEIIAVDRDNSNLAAFNSNVQWFNIDVCSKDELDPLFIGVDCLIHLAAKVHTIAKNQQDELDFYRINTEATMNIFKLCLKYNVKKVIFFSTISVYGYVDGIVDESTAVNPLTPYAKSKYEAERIGFEMVRENALPLCILRPATIYGKLDRGNYRSLIGMMKKGMCIVPGNGNALKPIIYVKDVAAAIDKLLDKGFRPGEVYIISQDNYTYSNIINSIKKVFCIKPVTINVPLFAIDLLFKTFKIDMARKLNTLTESINLDNSKMKQELGFVPEYDFSGGLEDCKDNYR